MLGPRDGLIEIDVPDTLVQAGYTGALPVPFDEGVLTCSDCWRIVDAGGNAVETQFEITNTWRAPYHGVQRLLLGRASVRVVFASRHRPHFRDLGLARRPIRPDPDPSTGWFLGSRHFGGVIWMRPDAGPVTARQTYRKWGRRGFVNMDWTLMGDGVLPGAPTRIDPHLAAPGHLVGYVSGVHPQYVQVYQQVVGLENLAATTPEQWFPVDPNLAGHALTLPSD